MDDIATRADIDHLLRAFYATAMVDPEIGYFFTDVARLDLEAHLPRIGDFWEQVLLQRPVYVVSGDAPCRWTCTAIGLPT